MLSNPRELPEQTCPTIQKPEFSIDKRACTRFFTLRKALRAKCACFYWRTPFKGQSAQAEISKTMAATFNVQNASLKARFNHFLADRGRNPI